MRFGRLAKEGRFLGYLPSGVPFVQERVAVRRVYGDGNRRRDGRRRQFF